MKKKIIAIPIIVAAAVVAGYFASPLFVNTTVDEALPEIMQSGDVKTLFNGNFMGVDDGVHNAEGEAKILSISDGRAVHKALRLENFRATNGPDLHVYLSKDPTGIDSGFVNLGRLKGNIGNQNYEIPNDVNLKEYNYVLIWCRMFAVLFGHAELVTA